MTAATTEPRPVEPLAQVLAEVATDRPRARLRLALAVVLGRGLPAPALERPGQQMGSPAYPSVVLRRRPVLVRAVAALGLVAAVVALACHLAWATLAGERLVLGGGSDTRSQVAEIEDARDGRARYSSPLLEDPVDNMRSLTPPGSTESGRTSGSAPTTLDGTPLAVALSALAIVGGVAAQRAVLRRLRQPGDQDSAAEPGPQPVEQSAAGPAEDDPEVVVDHHAAAEEEAGTGVEQPASGSAGSAGSESATTAVDRVVGPERDPAVDRALAAVDMAVDVAGDMAGDVAGDVAGADQRSSRRAGAEHPSAIGRVAVLYDRRAQRRVRFTGRARLQWPGHDLACRTQSLDIGGMRCLLPLTEVPTTVPIGTPARVTMSLSGTLVSIAATVAWSRRDQDWCRVGLRFDPLDERQRALLLAFVEAAEAED